MASGIVSEKLKPSTYNTPKWQIEFEPTVASIMRLKMQMSANAEQPNFQIKTDGTDLVFSFGDHSTHAGSFVVQAGINGQLKRAWSYPASAVSSILALVGDKTVRISDDGAVQITVDSGIAVYNYILPAQTK